MAQTEYGDYSGWSEANSGLQVEDIQDTQFVKIFADKYILPYLQLTSPPKRAQLQEKGYKNGIYNYTPPHYYYYFAELVNGTTLIFANNGDGTTGIVRMFIIMIDINGGSGENRFGHDIFPIMFNSQNGFFTLGENMSDDVVLQKCASGNAMFYCTELLKRNGWEINDKYPW